MMLKAFVTIFVCFNSPLAIHNSIANNWTDDLDFYHNMLEQKHIDLYHKISKQEFSTKLERIKSRLPELSGFQVIVELMRLTRDVGDGHTTIPLWGGKAA